MFRTQTTIDCCKDCKPPKRHPGCWGDCSEYKEQRAELDKQNDDRHKVNSDNGYFRLELRDRCAKNIKHNKGTHYR